MIVELLTIMYRALQRRNKKLKNKKDMSIDQTKVEAVEQPTMYVWGKTERAGNIVTVDESKSDNKFIAFTDGSRCARNLMGEMLLEARNEEDAKTLSLGFNPTGSGVKDIATTSTANSQNTPNTASKKESTTSSEVNVMMEMLRKLSAKNHANMPVKVNIPSKEVYDLFKDQMDITKKDLNEQIGLLVESQIDNLRDQLKEQIESFIKNYYNGTTTKSGNAES
jgi:hypothetical protein